MADKKSVNSQVNNAPHHWFIYQAHAAVGDAVEAQTSFGLRDRVLDVLYPDEFGDGGSDVLDAIRTQLMLRTLHKAHLR
jgi:hypothetical protein